MALPAQPRPDMPPPQPTESTDVSYPTSVKRQPAHLFLKKGETGDQVFKIAMLLCGLAVLGTLVLIVYELRAAFWAFVARFWLEVFWPGGLESGERKIWGAAVHLRDAGFFVAGAGDRGAVGDRAWRYLSRRCVRWRLRGPLSFIAELLAAIPSVVYGLWAIFVLVPMLGSYVSLFWPGLWAGRDFFGATVWRLACWRRE